MSNATSQPLALSAGGRVRAGVICVLGVTAMLAASAGPASAFPTISPQCFVTGGGAVDGDSFGGHGASYRNKPVEGGQTVDGSWTHTTPDGRTLRGNIEALVCRRNGGDPGQPFDEFSVADFTGSGTLDSQDVTFLVRAQDHGEPPGDDRYRIVISDTNGTVIYTSGGIMDSGNIQIHETNRGHP